MKFARQAAVYGKCIVADYNAVHKDKCAAEFMKLKDCYLVLDRHLSRPYRESADRFAGGVQVEMKTWTFSGVTKGVTW